MSRASVNSDQCAYVKPPNGGLKGRGPGTCLFSLAMDGSVVYRLQRRIVSFAGSCDIILDPVTLLTGPQGVWHPASSGSSTTRGQG